MNIGDATNLARKFLRRSLDVEFCVEVPEGIYAFNPDTEYLFAIVHGDDTQRAGGTEYLAVSKATGEV
jgi:hypothetical protein